MPREPKLEANQYQVDGNHYRKEGNIQHWDFAASQEFDYFQGQITKYVTRWKKKNGLKDLEKAKHFLEKYIELEKEKLLMPAVRMANEFFGERSIKNSGHEQEHPFGFDVIDDGA